MQKFTHSDFRKYLQKQPDQTETGQIQELCKESILYEIIFDLITETDSSNICHNHIVVDKSEIQFPAIEIMLQNIIGGSASQIEKYHFIELMYYSPAFYSRVMIKVEQIQAMHADEVIQDLKEINIISDQDILNTIKQDMSPEIKSENNSLKDSRESEKKPDNVFTMPNIRRIIYAAAAVLVLVPSTYILNIQYKTTYKNIEARKILTQNHRIYMNDQARLSGDYQSTGISQLMAGEADAPDYLEKANGLLDEVLDYKTDQKQALHLEAQILIIRKQYEAADSILNIALKQEITSPQMLNDLGVVYFGKKEWKKAKTFFKLSVKQDSNFPEAYYNLAITEIKLGNTDHARDAVNHFLGIEKDPGWKNAGLNLLNAMEGE